MLFYFHLSALHHWLCIIINREMIVFFEAKLCVIFVSCNGVTNTIRKLHVNVG